MNFRITGYYPRAGEPADCAMPEPIATLTLDAETYAGLAELAATVARAARADDKITGWPDANGATPARRRPLTVARLCYLLARAQLQCYVDCAVPTRAKGPENAGASGEAGDVGQQGGGKRAGGR